MDNILIRLRLDKILEHINEIQNDMEGITLDGFKKKSLLARDADIKRFVKKALKIKKRYLGVLMFHMNFGKEKQPQEKTS